MAAFAAVLVLNLMNLVMRQVRRLLLLHRTAAIALKFPIG
jgi:hypothetical protein